MRCNYRAHVPYSSGSATRGATTKPAHSNEESPLLAETEEAGVQQSRQHGRKIKDLKKTKESLKEGMNE